MGDDRHDLRSPEPWFLHVLDEDPERAARGFHEFAWRLLLSNAPPSFKELQHEERQDLIADLVSSVLDENFALLRKYENIGRPFAAWFSTVAHNRGRDLLRQKRRAQSRTQSLEADSEQGQPLSEILGHAGEDPGLQVDRKRLLDRIRHCMKHLSDRCRVLLEGAADGLRPRELVVLLGWPESHNKKAHDALRECRKSLKRCLDKS